MKIYKKGEECKNIMYINSELDSFKFFYDSLLYDKEGYRVITDENDGNYATRINLYHKEENGIHEDITETMCVPTKDNDDRELSYIRYFYQIIVEDGKTTHTVDDSYLKINKDRKGRITKYTSLHVYKNYSTDVTLPEYIMNKCKILYLPFDKFIIIEDKTLYDYECFPNEFL